MVVKFFSNKKGGSVGSIKYLLDAREQLKTARTLKGDPNLTKSIINSIERKQKVTMGCLSFEEKNISEEKKYQLMEEFEKTLLPNLEDRYNILWIEHTDKGRLELNFVIPKTDLLSNKALQPYYYKQDQKRIELFQNVHNLKNDWTSPNDPSKARNIEGATKQLNLQQDYEQLDKLLHNLVSSGAIKNREQLVELLKENNIEVNRQGKDYISVKLPESKRAKRFKKGIYSEEFKSVGELGEVSKRTRAEIDKYNSRDTQQELEQYQQELSKFTQYKAKANDKRYGQEHQRKDNSLSQSQSSSDNKLDSNINLDNKLNSNLFLNKEVHENSLDDTRKNQIPKQEQYQVHNNLRKQANKEQSRGHQATRNNRGLEDDSIGATAIKRIRAERKQLQSNQRGIREQVDRLYELTKANYNDLREESKEYATELQQGVGKLEREQQQVIKQSSNFIETVKNSFRELAEFGKRVENYITFAQLTISNAVDNLRERYEKNFKYNQPKLEQAFESADSNELMSFAELNKVKQQFKLSADADIKMEERAEKQSHSYGMSM